jgi:hypothetical protein
MEHKFLEPIELTDAELDVVSGGGFFGVKQVNVAKQVGIIKVGTGSGAVSVSSASIYNSFYYQSQSNYNSGSVTNNGSIS